MRAVLQVASEANVRVDGQVVGDISRSGAVVLLGINTADTEKEATQLAEKIVNLRIFGDEESALDLNAPMLVISQFTLYGDVRRGRRPSWSKAARPENSEPLYEFFIQELDRLGIETSKGVFGAMMDVSLVNSGPFTLVIDTDDLNRPKNS